MHFPHIKFLIIITAFLIVSLLGIKVFRWNPSNSEHEVVQIKVRPISLPYIRDDGTQLSANGIPRGTFRFPTNDYIENIELTAILLDENLNEKKNLIKTVLLVAGNFSFDTEFQLSSKFQPKIIVPAKIVDRITTDTLDSKSNITFLFTPDAVNFQASQLALIELDNKIPVTYLSIRKIADKEEKWLHTEYIRSLKPLRPVFFKPNKQEGTITFTHIYPPEK